MNAISDKSRSSRAGTARYSAGGDWRLEALIDRLPQRVGGVVSYLLRPESRWVRIPTSVLLIGGGLLAFLPGPWHVDASGWCCTAFRRSAGASVSALEGPGLGRALPAAMAQFVIATEQPVVTNFISADALTALFQVVLIDLVLAGRAASARHRGRHCRRDCGSHRICRHRDAAPAAHRPAASRRYLALVGLLEDVARAERRFRPICTTS